MLFTGKLPEYQGEHSVSLQVESCTKSGELKQKQTNAERQRGGIIFQNFQGIFQLVILYVFWPTKIVSRPFAWAAYPRALYRGFVQRSCKLQNVVPNCNADALSLTTDSEPIKSFRDGFTNSSRSTKRSLLLFTVTPRCRVYRVKFTM